MKTNRMLALTTVLALAVSPSVALSANVASANVALANAASDPIPDIVFVPENVQVIEAEKKWFGGFELEAKLADGTLIELTQQVKAFYLDKGFEISHEDLKEDDVELLFIKGQENVEVDIELEHNNLIEYSIDYETK